MNEEITEIQKSFDVARHEVQEPLFQRKYFKPIALAMAIATFNQLCGINALLE